MRPRRVLSACCGVLALSACTGGPRPISGRAPAAVSEVFPGAPARVTSVINAGDTISVQVYREPEVSLDSVVIDPAGNFQMPLLGSLHAAGKYPTALSEEVAAGLDAKYLVRPKVTVNITASESRRITLEGAVLQPGMFPYTPGLGLIDAVALARGTTRVAKTGQIAIFRNVGQERFLGVFDFDAIRAGRSPDVQLQPGDTIVVGTSGARQVFQDILSTVPLLGIFTRFR